MNARNCKRGTAVAKLCSRKGDTLMRIFGYFALVVGGYLLYRNRFEVQRVLERFGIDTPVDDSSLGNTVRSGLAKGVGNVQHGLDKLTSKTDVDKDVRTAI